MGRHMKRVVAGALAVTLSVSGCGLNHTSLSSNHPPTGNPKSVANSNKSGSHPSNQANSKIDGNAPSGTTAPTQITDEGFVPFQLNSVQLDLLHQALANINVTDNGTTFFGAAVLSPYQVPQGTQLNNVFSGGQAGYPVYVSFVFNSFTLTLLNQSPLFSDMKKLRTTQIHGQTATWYTRSSQGENLYFLEYAVNGTYVSFTTGLKNITQAQVETVAKSLKPLTHG